MDILGAITILLAIYGAALSTFIFVRELRGDRINVHIAAHSCYVPDTEAGWHVSVEVVNIGRRPLTIVATGLNLRRSGPNKVTFRNSDLPLPRELTEGQRLTSLSSSKAFRLDEIEFAWARDATGVEYKSSQWPIGPNDPLARKIIADVWDGHV